MLKLLFLSTIFLSASSYAQVKIEPTNTFIVKGNIDKALTVSNSTIDSLTAVNLGDVTTVNHLGEVKSVRKNVKAVLLKNILAGVKLNVAKPGDLASCYFVAAGSDGHKFVLSYNEVFNGSNVYVITESNGQSWQSIQDRIALLILLEPHKGHIAMKGLEKLSVEKVE